MKSTRYYATRVDGMEAGLPDVVIGRTIDGRVVSDRYIVVPASRADGNSIPIPGVRNRREAVARAAYALKRLL